MLRFRQGFKFDLLTWHGPRDPVPLECSNCARKMDEREEALRVNNGHRYAVLCNECNEAWTVHVRTPQR